MQRVTGAVQLFGDVERRRRLVRRVRVEVVRPQEQRVRPVDLGETGQRLQPFSLGRGQRQVGLVERHLLDKVGETFDGVISGVNSFGIFVELNDIYVSGLVHITALDYDYFHFDPIGHRLTGERTGQVYRLGDRLRVKVAAVNLEDRKIDFELAR